MRAYTENSCSLPSEARIIDPGARPDKRCIPIWPSSKAPLCVKFSSLILFFGLRLIFIFYLHTVNIIKHFSPAVSSNRQMFIRIKNGV